MNFKRAAALLLSIVLVVLAFSSCVRVESDNEEQTESELEQETKVYVYKGDSIEDEIEDEPPIDAYNDLYAEKYEETKKDHADEKNPIKNIIDRLPDSIKPHNEESTERKTVKVKIPAGVTVAKIFAILDHYSVCKFSDLMNAAKNFDFSVYPLIKAQKNTGRANVLEGYLCSGVYEFYVNSKPEDVIGAMLRRTESKITTQHRRLIAQRGKTVDEIITIASIIEKESADKSEMKKISAVINNRLAQGMKLEMASCAMYIDSDIKPYIDDPGLETLPKYIDYYNTFICPALPASPICTPSADAIEAALNPEGNYKYFCVDENGKYYYSDTLKEHEQNLVAAGIMDAEDVTEPEKSSESEN